MATERRGFRPVHAVLVLALLVLVVGAVKVTMLWRLRAAAYRQSASFIARADSVFAAELAPGAAPDLNPALDPARLRRARRRARPLIFFTAPAEALADLLGGAGRSGVGSWALRRQIALQLLGGRVGAAARRAGTLAYRLECAGDSDAAGRWYRVAYGLARMAGEHPSSAWSLERLAELQSFDSIVEPAAGYLHRALGLYAEAADWGGVARVEENLGCRYHAAGEHTAALRWYVAALETCGEFELASGHVLENLRGLRSAMGAERFRDELVAERGAGPALEIIDELVAPQSTGQAGTGG